MKKTAILIVAFFALAFTAKSSAIPVYTDEIAPEYIYKVKNTKNVNLKQTLPVYDTENSIEIKIYSRERIALKNIYKKVGDDVVAFQNYQINDQVPFYVVEDVIKNNKLFIKKDTKVIGRVREAQLGYAYFTAPDEIQISMFTTKDINNNTVELYGTVLNEGKDTGLFQIILSGIPSLRASIPRNKVYTLYYK